ncbi:LPXTG cell wall anchor domain-containing protein [Staphylococcus sp. IVB6214]|uniref:LPXTG cell wall anchor domain-containing protein n=1 Tax=Staphylococcus sp. IVB6214 TaxID=2989766 RepID=UPI0021D24C56|nr:LPXTG cell wall anchor domain-containing protein [Staphylococcus sp. IVB6214]UXR83170.1 LPXTG cell wall anchor domain-containing protein [Staphylococcus sp. IVB6214]
MSQKLFVRTLITGLATSALLAGGHAAKAAEETAPVMDNQEQPQTSNQTQANTPQTDTTSDQPTTTDSTEPEETQPTTDAPEETPIAEEQPIQSQPEQPNAGEENLVSDTKPAEVSEEELKQQEIENAQANLNTANQQVKAAQHERDKAAQEKAAADQQLKAAQSVKTTSTKQVDQKIANETKKLKNKTSNVQTTQSQLDKKKAEIANKEQQLKNYKPGVKEPVVHTSNVPEEAESQRYHEWVEDVKYTGSPQVVKLKANKGKYIPNNERISQFFVDYLNELKRINNLPGHVTLSTNPAVQAFSQARADESAANYRAHYTELPDADKYQGAENLARHFAYESLPLSDEEVAYTMLLAWFSDYNNYQKGYGHRSNLLAANGEIGFATVRYGDEGDEIYTLLSVMNAQGWDRENVYNKVTETQVGDKLQYRLDGKEVHFVPKKVFQYITTETIDKSGKLATELAQLKKEKTALDSKLNQYNKEITKIEKTISNLKKQRQLISSNNATQQKAINDAKALVAKNNKALADAEKKLADAKKNKAVAQKALDKLTKVDEPNKPEQPAEQPAEQPTIPSKPAPEQPKGDVKPGKTAHPSTSTAAVTKPVATPKQDKPTMDKTLGATEMPSKGIKVTLPSGEKVTIPNKAVGTTLTAEPMGNMSVTTQSKVTMVSTNAQAPKAMNSTKGNDKSDDNMQMLPNTGQEQKTGIFAGLVALLAGIATCFGFRRKSSQK